MTTKNTDPKMLDLITAIAALAGHNTAPVSADGKEGQVLSVRGDQRTIYLPPTRDLPRFKRAVVKFTNADDFAKYVSEHAHQLCSRIFLNTSNPSNGVTATAIMDYHEAGAGTPKWGHHQAVLLAPLAPELKAWMDGRGKVFSQEEFALFIEDHAADVSQPAPADLIKIALELEGSLTGSYAAKMDLDRSKVRLHFQMDEASANQSIEVPRQILLRLPMFTGGACETFQVNLAMKINNQRPTFIWRMPGLTSALRDAARHLRDLMAEQTKLPVYEAMPPEGMEKQDDPKVIAEAAYPAPSSTHYSR